MGAKYLAITGGVGGAKLALGLTHLEDSSALAFVVNTGDDFEHLGLHISPDIDTLTYTLADLSNPDTGWGRRGETWHFIETLRLLGGEAWFNLGDRDLALHALRTARLREGATLTAITRELTTRLGIAHSILPMTDAPVRTVVHTAAGALAFQHYFVRDRCEPAVTGFSFAGAADARMSSEVLGWLDDSALRGVIICPSNPFVSIDPVLAVPGLRERLRALPAPVVAVSPIVAGLALKGPTVKMMSELKVPQSAVAVAAHYADILDGFILDHADAALLPSFEGLDLAAIAAPTVMVTLADKIELARVTLDLIHRLNADKKAH
ncbi:MAG: 2-phospho-L-lactate transferase [Gammaproteobacteria bacterium]|nr:2-phospho-L-lactate transferase [Gammaproteobacteria bacterium]